MGELKNPFSSRLWTMRRAVQRGYEALYTVQVIIHYHLRAFRTCICCLLNNWSAFSTCRIPPCTPDSDPNHVLAVIRPSLHRSCSTCCLAR
jgi:hypothetical protein